MPELDLPIIAISAPRSSGSFEISGALVTNLVFLKSKTAFSKLEFLGSEFAEKNLYYPKKLSRDTSARAAFRSEKNKTPAENAIYMLDIIRERWQNDDSRLQRIVLR